MRIERDDSMPCARAKARSKPWKRRPAPAGRRAPGVRTQRALHHSRYLDREARDIGGEGVDGVVRPPVEKQVRRIPSPLLERVLPAWTRQRGGGYEDTHPRSPGRRQAHEGHLLDAGQPLVGRRWLELPERSHLGRRGEHAGLTLCQASQLLGSRERAKLLEQALDEIDLRLSKRRVEPDAPRRDSMPARRFDRVAPRRASEVRVVEDGPPDA